MNSTDCCSKISTRNIFYKILIKDSDSYELVFEKDLTELQIIKNFIQIPSDSCTKDEIIKRLKYLFACIEFGNCVRVMALLPKIVDTLLYLCKSPIFKNVWLTVLQLFEQIILTKEMATSWHPLLSEILSIPLCNFQYKTEPQASMVSAALENIASVLPLEKTIDVTYELWMETEYENQKEWDQLLWSLKLLYALSTQQSVEVTQRNVRKLTTTLIEITQYSCMGIYTYIQLYQKSKRKPKVRGYIKQTLKDLIRINMIIAKEYYVLPKCCSDYESHLEKKPEHSVRSESEIINIACEIQPTTPIEQRKKALMDFCECIAQENFQMERKHFYKIFLMLIRLVICANTSMEITIVLDVVEKALYCRRLVQFWNQFYGDMLIVIIFAYNKDRKEIMEAIDIFIRNIASELPCFGTVAILDAIIATAEYPLKLCSMKILWTIAEKDLPYKTYFLMVQLLRTVVRAIYDPERKIRLSAESVIFKLCTRLCRQRIINAIEENCRMTTRLRILLNRIR